MGAGHTHSGSLAAAHRGRLAIALGLTTAVLVAEIVGAVITGSLALLADAGHLLTDAAGIGLALLAITYAQRPATPQRTFGYYRLEILAAVANAVLLLLVAGLILIEAARRFGDPPEVAGGGMLGFALIGLAANVAGLLLLREGGKESLAVRGAYFEVLGDLLGSAAVVVAALVITVTDAAVVDPVASVVVALLILPRVWMLLRESVDVLLEATPRGVDIHEVRQHLLRTHGVIDIHDLHVWTITSGMRVMSVHVVIAPEMQSDGGRVLDELQACLADDFDVAHSTFQLEPVGHADHEDATHR